jgi:hypothetical protein
MTRILHINPLGPVSAAVAAPKAGRVNPDQPAPNRATAVFGNADIAFGALKTRNEGVLRFTAR